MRSAFELGNSLSGQAAGLASTKLGEAERSLVEAAGVEPASENTSSQSTTCVSPFDCRGRLRTEPSAPPASLDSSRPRASRRNAGTSLLNDGQSQATGLLRLTAHWFLSSESVVCVRSYVCFPQDLRGRGPRHAFRDPAPPSKPNRPHRSETAIPVYGTVILDVTRCSRFRR